MAQTPLSPIISPDLTLCLTLISLNNPRLKSFHGSKGV